MEINKDSIVTKVCGLKSDIKLNELCEHINEEDVDWVIQELLDSQYVDGDGEWSITCDEDGNNICYNNHLTDDDNVTSLLEKIFGEKYLMMVTGRVYYSEYNDYPTSPTYLESYIENESLSFYLTKVTKNHHEEETTELTKDNFLTKDEEKEWKGYSDNSEIEHTYDYGFYFIKRDDFNEDTWWLGWIRQE